MEKEYSREELERMLEEKKMEAEKVLDDVKSNAPIVAINSNKLTVTDLSSLQRYAEGNIVELPEFGEGQPFVARMTRASMMMLASEGKIPNSLLSTANELFAEGTGDVDDEDLLRNMYGVMQTIAEASLIEPSYQDIVNAGLRLTDEQLVAIFSYSQKGVNALSSFREE